MPDIHVIAADADKFFVNAFLIEGDGGVVLIDTHFLVSSARRVAAALDRLGKPLVGVVITHPHPDHYNGLPTILEACPGTPVYASRATIEGIKASQASKREAWTPIYGDDYPMTDALPDHAVGTDALIDFAGITLRLIDLGGGECADNTIIHLPQANALIASDLVYSRCHPWLAEGRTSAWLRQIADVKGRFGDVSDVYAGHGSPGGLSLLDDQRRYIEAFRERVAKEAEGGSLGDEAVASIVSQTREGLEGWPLEGLIEMNARAVAKELAT